MANNHPNKTGAFGLLAWSEFLRYASRYKAALKSLNLLESQKQHLNKNQWEQANLARSDTLIALSDFDEGTLILNDLLKERRKRSGKNHPSTAKLMNALSPSIIPEATMKRQRYSNENNCNPRRDPW